ncbi:MAG: IS21-like element helper ATPase IstB [Prevotella sp.]|nr:IS21-like element helper ATPase IstB [Prevotella sp.]
MFDEITVKKLREMKLNVMADVFKEQQSDPRYHSMSFEERFGMLVDRQWENRKNNRIKSLIKQSNLSNPSAVLENIDYSTDRMLDKDLINKLATCSYIHDRRSVIIMGATGSGKTYLACALGMAAVRNFIQVRYIRLPELLTELAIAKGSGTMYKVIDQYKKYPLLIIDEWLLHDLTETEARDLLEIIEYREIAASTIFCSQFDIPGWREKIGSPIVADAVCDRIVHKSYHLIINSKDSMRKLNGISDI